MMQFAREKSGIPAPRGLGNRSQAWLGTPLKRYISPRGALFGIIRQATQSLEMVTRLIQFGRSIPLGSSADIVNNILFLETRVFSRDNPSMNATVLDKKRRMTLPESVCEALDLQPRPYGCA
jgi:hypothetical protein